MKLFSFNHLRTEGPLDSGKLARRIRIVAYFSILFSGRTFYEDPEFPIFEFCEQLTIFLSSDGSRFDFESISTHENPWLSFLRVGERCRIWARYPTEESDAILVPWILFLREATALVERFNHEMTEELDGSD